MTSLDPFGAQIDEASLREAGLFPYSSLAVRCGAVVGVLIALVSVRRSVLEILDQHVLHPSGDPQILLLSLLSSLAPFMFGIAGAGGIGALIFGLAQTRGRLDVGSLAPQFDRLSPFRMPPLKRVADRLLTLFFLWVFGAPLMGGAWYVLYVLSLGAWLGGVGDLGRFGEGVFSSGIAFLALAGILGAVVSWWAMRQRFRWKYFGGKQE